MVASSSHFRSTSMPSRPHPLVLKVDEELKKVRYWQNSSSSSSSSMAEILSSNFDHLSILYNSIEELLRLPLTQQALSCVEAKWVNDMVDDSLILLDVCSTIRNDLLLLKEQLHDLQSAFRIRRIGDDQGMSARIEAYLQSRKKLKKEMSKCLGVLKTLESRSIILPAGMAASPDHNQDGLPVFNVLKELRDINITIFRALALFVSCDTRPKSGAGRWSLVSRVLDTRRVACEGEEGINEAGRVDIALHSLLHTYRSSKVAEVIHVQNTQRQLETLEICIKDLEVAVECMFRHLIQTRVSLLNLLTG